jgi:MoaA/NifB/PqqE/SkfB family radical SAM enzyme
MNDKTSFCPAVEKYYQNVVALTENVPKALSIEVTTRCHLNCVYCTTDREKGVDITLDKLERIKRKLGKIERIVLCGVGEGFLHRKIYDIIEIFKDFRVDIITSGSIDIDFNRLSRLRNVNTILFSIDSVYPETMRRICGKYDFGKMLDNLARLNEYPYIIRAINTTINEYNLPNLPELVPFAAEHRLMAVIFNLPVGGTEWVVKNCDEINRQIAAIRERAKGYKKVALGNFYGVNCYNQGRMVPFLRLNGDLFTCCEAVFKNRPIATEFYENDDPIEEIWERNGRTLLAEHSFCRECSSIRNIDVVVGKLKENNKP